MWQSIISIENLLFAAKRAALGKRGKRAAAEFEYQQLDRVLELQAELQAKIYRPGNYRHFVIYEPKRRRISAAPFRDRVVHHALCNVIEPVFDRQFIANSFANRVGKGSHAALAQLQIYTRQYRFALRADVMQHFPSLDHAILRRAIARVVDDPDVLWLVDVILHSGRGVLEQEYTPVLFEHDTLSALTRPRGLPIGNLTSQFWSNVYLNRFDYFVTRQLGCTAYVRYVDDFVLFGNDKHALYEWKQAIIHELGRLRLTIHESEAQVVPVAQGIPWLGFVTYPTHRLLKRRKMLYFSRKFGKLVFQYQHGSLSFADLSSHVQGWVAHASFGDTWRLRKFMFRRYPLHQNRPALGGGPPRPPVRA